MFEFERLLGPDEGGIALQTRLGSDIANSKVSEISQQRQQSYTALVEKYGQNWQQRKPPTPEYNCAGHVWASRRTCIYDEDAWQLILREDGYRRTHHPLPDDLVVYRERRHGILHIARVVELRPGIGAKLIAWVVSKLGDWTGEVMHFEHDVPYQSQGFDVKLEYWTDRPPETGQ